MHVNVGWKLSDGKIRKLNAVAIFFCDTHTHTSRIRGCVAPGIRIPPPYIFECNVYTRACYTRAWISSARIPINCASAIIVIRTCSRRSIAYLSPADLRKWSKSAARKLVNRDFQQRAFAKSKKQRSPIAHGKKILFVFEFALFFRRVSLSAGMRKFRWRYCLKQQLKSTKCNMHANREHDIPCAPSRQNVRICHHN